MHQTGRLLAFTISAAALLGACGDVGGVRFQLKNQTVSPFFLSTSWVFIGDAQGNPLQIIAPDCSQRCGQTPLLCSPPAAVVATTGTKVDAGDTHEFRWNGHFFRSNGTGTCVEEVSAPAGHYSATLCWDYNEQGQGVAKQVCAIESFELGTVTEVVHQVIATPPTPVVITLRNISSNSMWTSQGFGSPNWLQLLGPDGQPVDAFGGCTCICNTLCALCGRTAAAPIPSVQELLPGQELRFDFNGLDVDFLPAPNNGTCALPSLAQSGQYTAHFCWGRGHGPEANGSIGEALTDVVCEDKHFELGVDQMVAGEAH
jgi:hypothetical protein